jgi:hypothetical protein
MDAHPIELNSNGNSVAADNGMNGTDAITYFNSSNGQSRYRIFAFRLTD